MTRIIASYEDAVAFLDDHIGRGVQPGLDRIQRLVDAMGSPHEGYPLVHVAGTNGKTSTTRLTALLLVAHGLSAGTYISPHLQSVEERIAINGHIATKEQFVQAASDVAVFAELLEEREGVALTYFELTTAMAFAFFADRAVDAAVIEVGLGGRLDATNVIDADVAVVTSIGLEHTEFLGGTLAEIAGEKVAIAGPGSILVTGDLEPEAEAVTVAHAKELGIQNRRFGHDFSVDAIPAVGGWELDISGAEADYSSLALGVHGRYQTINAAVSVAAAEALLGRSLEIDAVQHAMSVFAAPGRLERVAIEPLVMLDGAHNPAGFAALADSLRDEFPSMRWTLVVAAMDDKDVESMVPHLADRIDAVIATSIDTERAIPATDLARRIESVVDVPVEAVGDAVGAVEIARRKVGAAGAVLVTGSIYMVGRVREALVPAERI